LNSPSTEEIKSWSESFDKLMQSPSGRYYFREFLRSEYSEENMLFWMACEELKTEQQNPQIVEEKARLIYEDYISILSPKEVILIFLFFFLIT
jgi:regulator of G-protein signaling